MTLCPQPVDPVRSFIWVFQYQPLASSLLTQPSRYENVENNLQADEKGLQDMGQVVVWVIHLYLLH